MKAQGKRFLTERGDEGGSIRWTLGKDAYFNGDINAEIIITDCNKSIYLDFSYTNNKALGKRVAKLESLIEELQDFRESLLKAEIVPKKFYY